MLRRAEATEVCPLHGRRRWGLGLQVSEEGVRRRAGICVDVCLLAFVTPTATKLT